MSKQPDKEIREKLRLDIYNIAGNTDDLLAIMTLVHKYKEAAQLQLVDELMEQAVEVSTIQYNYENGDKMVGGFTNSAVPIPILQQYKANLSGKGE